MGAVPVITEVSDDESETSSVTTTGSVDRLLARPDFGGAFESLDMVVTNLLNDPEVSVNRFCVETRAACAPSVTPAPLSKFDNGSCRLAAPFTTAWWPTPSSGKAAAALPHGGRPDCTQTWRPRRVFKYNPHASCRRMLLGYQHERAFMALPAALEGGSLNKEEHGNPLHALLHGAHALLAHIGNACAALGGHLRRLSEDIRLVL